MTIVVPTCRDCLIGANLRAEVSRLSLYTPDLTEFDWENATERARYEPDPEQVRYVTHYARSWKSTCNPVRKESAMTTTVVRREDLPPDTMSHAQVRAAESTFEHLEAIG